MTSHYYIVENGGVKIEAEVDENSPINGNNLVEKAVFRIAEDKIINKGGWRGPSTVRFLNALTERKFNPPLTHKDFPGVKVWNVK